MEAYHPFRSAKARDKYLRFYDQKAERWPGPSESRMVETSSGLTLVRINGPAGAQPLMLLHGVNGNSLQWLPNIQALSKDFRTYALDNITDYGRSVSTRPFSGADDFVNWLEELFQALDLDGPVNLAGLSYGGWLAAQYALRHPEKLQRIILLAPAGTVLPLSAGWILRAVLCAIPLRHFTRRFLYWMLPDLAEQGPSGRASLEEFISEAYLASRSFKRRRLVNPTVLKDEEWRSLKVPALFLVGEHEKIYPAGRALERLQKAAPQIKTVLIPRAGHDLTLVQAERVQDEIINFLKNG